jgi:hypothetical protein
MQGEYWEIMEESGIFMVTTPGGGVSFVLDRQGLRRLGSAFLSVAFGAIDGLGVVLQVASCADMMVILHREDVQVVKSSKSVKSSNHQDLAQNPTRRGLVIRLLFGTRCGDLLLALFERVLGLAVVVASDIG